MTTLNRRQALAGIGIASATVLAGSSGVIAAPTTSEAAELIADWQLASSAYEEVADQLEALEIQHREVVENWPSVEVGFGAPRHSFPLGIDDTFERQFSLLRGAYGEDGVVKLAITTLEILRDRAKADLAAFQERHQLEREACGLVAVEREAEIAAKQEQVCFHSLLDFRPATPEDEALIARWALDFVTRWPNDEKVPMIRALVLRDHPARVSAG